MLLRRTPLGQLPFSHRALTCVPGAPAGSWPTVRKPPAEKPGVEIWAPRWVAVALVRTFHPAAPRLTTALDPVEADTVTPVAPEVCAGAPKAPVCASSAAPQRAAATANNFLLLIGLYAPRSGDGAKEPSKTSDPQPSAALAGMRHGHVPSIGRTIRSDNAVVVVRKLNYPPTRCNRWLALVVSCGRDESSVGVGDLAEAGEGAAQFGRGPLAQMPCPLGLHLGLDYPSDRDRRLPSRCDLHQPGPGVGRVRYPADIARTLQLVDEEARGLFGDPGLLGQLGQPGALRPDPGDQSPLGDRDVVEAGRGQRLEHAGLHGPGGDEAEQAEVQLVPLPLLVHPRPLTFVSFSDHHW